MSFRSLLRHSVVIKRRVGVLDVDDEPTYDELGQPVTILATLEEVPCRITPLQAKEVAQLSQAGPVVSTHRIFMQPYDLHTGDLLVPQPTDGRLFEVNTIDDAGGQGHHLQVEATLITSDEVEPS